MEDRTATGSGLRASIRDCSLWLQRSSLPPRFNLLPRVSLSYCASILRQLYSGLRPVSLAGGLLLYVCLPVGAITYTGGTPNLALPEDDDYGWGDAIRHNFTVISSSISMFTAVTSLTGDVTGSGPGATATTIAQGAVDTGKILMSAVTGPKIAAGAVDTTKLSAGAVDTSRLNTDAVTTIKILDLNVTTLKIAANAVDTTKLGSGAVGQSQLQNSSITTLKLVDASVDTAKLLTGAVDTNRLNTDAVTNTKILDGAVDTRKINALHAGVKTCTNCSLTVGVDGRATGVTSGAASMPVIARVVGSDSGAATCTVSCAGDNVLVGGGCNVNAAGVLSESYPSSATTWTCTSDSSSNCVAYALCADQ